MKKTKISSFKLILISTLCVSLLASMNVSTFDSHATTYKLGDVNLDGIVNWDDLTLMDQYIAEEITLTDQQIAMGDVLPTNNYNHYIDWYDRRDLNNFLNGEVSFLPASNKIAFSSDVHEQIGNIQDWSSGLVGTSLNLDYFIFGGDYTVGYNTNGSTVNEKAVKDSVHAVFPNTTVYLGKGNHDYQAATDGRYSSGLTVDPATHNYGVYIMNPTCPSLQELSINEEADPKFEVSDINRLDGYLNSADPSKPFFVVSHIPLHTHTYTIHGKVLTREYEKASDLLEILNGHKNVIFLWGHNHSCANPTDDNYWTIKKRENGDTIKCKKDQGELPIQFTYASMGSMKDGRNISRYGLCVFMSAVPGGNDVYFTYKNLNGYSVANGYVNIRE